MSQLPITLNLLHIESLWINRKSGTVDKVWRVEGFEPFITGGIASHHIVAGILGILACLIHLTVRPPQQLSKATLPKGSKIPSI